MVRDSLRFRAGFPPPVALIGANLFLWQRATAATSRDLSFFNVGVSFRVGMLLLFSARGLLAYLRGHEPVSFLWLYFALGLTAVALARISEKAVEAQSAGSPLRRCGLLQLLLAVGLTLGSAWLVSLVYSPQGSSVFSSVRSAVAAARPDRLRGAAVLWARLLDPFLVWLEARLSRLLRDTTWASRSARDCSSRSRQASWQGCRPGSPTLLMDLADRRRGSCRGAGGHRLFPALPGRVRKAPGAAKPRKKAQRKSTFGGGILARGAGPARRGEADPAASAWARLCWPRSRCRTSTPTSAGWRASAAIPAGRPAAGRLSAGWPHLRRPGGAARAHHRRVHARPLRRSSGGAGRAGAVAGRLPGGAGEGREDGIYVRLSCASGRGDTAGHGVCPRPHAPRSTLLRTTQQ